MVSSISKALHHRVDSSLTQTVVTPIYQNSAFPASSPYFYTRKDNPNSSEIETALTHLEPAEHAISFATGMAAINAVIGLLKPNATVVVNRDIYGCSLRLFQREAERLGLNLVQRDLSLPEDISRIPAETDMVFFETPTNPFLKVISIEAIARQVCATCPEALVVVDNTWASPLFQHPLTWGADISIHSATKYISGHSDVMGGFALCNANELAEGLRDHRFYGGAILDPNSAWLLRRSLQTLPLRMQSHVDTLGQMAAFLSDCPQISSVYLPEIDGRQLTNYGGILFFDLSAEFSEGYETFRDALHLFGDGTGMAAVTSMVAQPWSGSHASLADRDKLKMGLSRGLVRLCFGLEPVEDLQSDITQALAALQVSSRKIEPVS